MLALCFGAPWLSCAMDTGILFLYQHQQWLLHIALGVMVGSLAVRKISAARQGISLALSSNAEELCIHQWLLYGQCLLDFSSFMQVLGKYVCPRSEFIHSLFFFLFGNSCLVDLSYSSSLLSIWEKFLKKKKSIPGSKTCVRDMSSISAPWLAFQIHLNNKATAVYFHFIKTKCEILA